MAVGYLRSASAGLYVRAIYVFSAVGSLGTTTANEIQAIVAEIDFSFSLNSKSISSDDNFIPLNKRSNW